MPTLQEFRHVVNVEAPGPPVPDGEGGYTEPWAPLDPATWHCAIAPATARDLENVAAGTVIAQATHIIRGRFHPGITTKARLLFEARVFNVLAVVNRDELDLETDLVAAEVVS